MLEALALPGLSGHGTIVLCFALVVFLVFLWDRFSIASVCLGILVFLTLFFLAFPYPTAEGTLDPFRFFAGFGHPALIAISGLMVLGHSLVLTGALEPAARRLSALVARRPGLAMAAVLASAALASGVVNDTPVVVLLIPLLIAATRQGETSCARYLMPMNFAVLIGGMATTIGTSTNLIVVSVARDLGLPPFGMFDFYSLVAMAAVPALLYLWLAAPRLLGNVCGPEGEFVTDVFDAEFRVEAGGWLDGKELREVLAATDGRMHIEDLRSATGAAITRLPTVTLKAGDRILLQDTVENLKSFESALETTLHGSSGAPESEKESGDADDRARPDATSAHAIVAQIIVTPESPLVGRSVREVRLADRHRLAVVGMHPVRERFWASRDRIVDRRLVEGDILLVQGDEQTIRTAQRDGLGLLLASRFVIPRQERAWVAIAVMLAVVAAAAFKLLPIGIAALAGVAALMVTRSITWQDVSGSLSVKVIMLVTASLALGDALTVTGGVTWMADGFARFAEGVPPAWILAGLMLMMGLVTNFVSNNAAAAIGTPLGIDLARALALPAEPFVLAVLFGCNLCYLTPMGYQTNLLVMNAAGYRFADFLRVGAPLFLIMWAALTGLLVWRFGLLPA
ncbi:MAG: SLC13 family permease [Betaproteobacteria bacterium]|nr:SLC13 family permease [Betaproteobacteria bacterium]